MSSTSPRGIIPTPTRSDSFPDKPNSLPNSPDPTAFATIATTTRETFAGLSIGIIGPEIFSAAVVMVLATTMVAPPLMRLVFPRHAFVPVMVEETIAGPPEEGEARA